MLRLTRPRVHALNRYWYRKFEPDEDVLIRGHRVLAQALGDGKPQTRRELAQRLAEAGIEADGLRLGYLLMHAELEELICSGPRRGSSTPTPWSTSACPAPPSTPCPANGRWPSSSCATSHSDAQPRRAGGAFLIPMYDETIVAYQDLRVVLAHQPPRSGLLDRAIVIDGRTHGSWKRTVTARAVMVAATLFGPLAAHDRRARRNRPTLRTARQPRERR